MNHNDRGKIYNDIVQAEMDEHYGHLNKKRKKLGAQPMYDFGDGVLREVHFYISSERNKEILSKLESYGFDWNRIYEIFRNHFDESIIRNEKARMNEGFSNSLKQVVDVHKQTIKRYKRFLNKIKDETPFVFASFIHIEKTIEVLEEMLEWAEKLSSPRKSIVKILKTQEREILTYIRAIEKSYYKARDFEKIPDTHIFAVIADLLNSFYRSEGFFYPFVNLSKENDHETILGHRKLTGKIVKTNLDNEVQHPPKHN